MMDKRKNEITIDGLNVSSQLKQLKETTKQIAQGINPVNVMVSNGDWNPEKAISVRFIGGCVTKTDLMMNNDPSYDQQKRPPPLDITRSTYTKSKEVLLSNTPINVRMIDNKLWICEHDGVIQVFDLTFKTVNKIENESWGNVNDVACLSNGQIVIAADNGLHQTHKNGKHILKIANGKHTCALVFGGYLYIKKECSNFLDKYSIGGFVKFEEQIRLPTSGFMTLCVTDKTIWACRSMRNGLYKLTNTGDEIAKVEYPTESWSGLRDRRYICQVDISGQVLVAFEDRHNIQVLKRDQTWSMIKLVPQVESPTRVLIESEKLYIISTEIATLHEYIRK